MRAVLLPLAVALVLPFGCAHQQDKKASTLDANRNGNGAATTPLAHGDGTGAGDKTCASDVDCGSRQLCIRAHCTDITPGLAECSEIRVSFDFNSSLIADDGRTELERRARCLKADHALHVTIEGHADERGTEEYNMALGDQRATAIAKYLRDLGVSPDQLKTVSYGKEQPLCTEHDEACWSKNRRGQLKPHETAKR